MLSFQISAVDLGLFVAIIVLFFLYLRFSNNFDWLNQKKRLESFVTVNERKEKRDEVIEKKERGMMIPMRSGKCPYNFGYLRKLSNEASIPPECLECSRILECRYEIISDSE